MRMLLLGYRHTRLVRQTARVMASRARLCGAGFVPLAEHRGALGAALVVGVAVQEATRLCAWLAHRCAPHCRAWRETIRSYVQTRARRCKDLQHGLVSSPAIYFSMLLSSLSQYTPVLVAGEPNQRVTPSQESKEPHTLEESLGGVQAHPSYAGGRGARAPGHAAGSGRAPRPGADAGPGARRRALLLLLLQVALLQGLRKHTLSMQYLMLHRLFVRRHLIAFSTGWTLIQ